jgi:hypothetical protein
LRLLARVLRRDRRPAGNLLVIVVGVLSHVLPPIRRTRYLLSPYSTTVAD